MRVSLAGCVITFGSVRCIKGMWGFGGVERRGKLVSVHTEVKSSSSELV